MILSPRTAAVPEMWVGTFHGNHDDTRVVVTATRNDSHPLPYGWSCPCGIAQRFPTEHGLWDSAWRHVHPPRWRNWARKLPGLRLIVQPTARLTHDLSLLSTGALAHERARRLAAIADAAIADQAEEDLTCASVTGEAIQKRAADCGIPDVTHTEAVNLINECLYQRRTRLTAGTPGEDR
ncbi:hypothetical protein [Streptomyces sp. NPDC101455]|uniref:hypothetical protein n=1 Tax=Streptomyces sp. NPDC101455 TaxID=3366142 RepID=UPI003819CD07